ncbi:MAG: cytochrome c [Candidatus Obscuribacterales bacterium]|nr:cytochrome c [Candidatus Obscuribacterales bacterium]
MKNRISICAMIFLMSITAAGDCKTPASKSGQKKAAAPTKAELKAMITKGKDLFAANQCLDCHSLAGKGNTNDGISLDDITNRRTVSFIQKQLKDPEAHVANAPKAFDGDPNMMPAPNLNSTEINAVIEYLKSLSPPKQKTQTKT